MSTAQHNALHGKTLEQILTELVAHYQWQGLAERVDVRCFKSNPSIKSSLTFLRKTPGRGRSRTVVREAAAPGLTCHGAPG
jgi:Uncharacterized conserved protein